MPPRTRVLVEGRWTHTPHVGAAACTRGVRGATSAVTATGVHVPYILLYTVFFIIIIILLLVSVPIVVLSPAT